LHNSSEIITLAVSLVLDVGIGINPDYAIE
jgi:hypothetical protein